MDNLRQQFIEFSVAANVLKFGKYLTKAGRNSPYFFNAGVFSEGAILSRLAYFYAQTLINSGLEFDMLFGPAYKGITLASSTAVELALRGKNKQFSYNRKETKDHGEGGSIVGGPLKGRVLIIDDVISAGTSVHESAKIIYSAGAKLCGVVVALDRMERSVVGDILSPNSAAKEIEVLYKVPVISICNLADLLDYLSTTSGYGENSTYYTAIEDYKNLYGAAP